MEAEWQVILASLIKKTAKEIEGKPEVLLIINIYQAGDYHNTVKFYNSIKYSHWRVTEVSETC